VNLREPDREEKSILPGLERGPLPHQKTTDKKSTPSGQGSFSPTVGGVKKREQIPPEAVGGKGESSLTKTGGGGRSLLWSTRWRENGRGTAGEEGRSTTRWDEWGRKAHRPCTGKRGKGKRTGRLTSDRLNLKGGLIEEKEKSSSCLLSARTEPTSKSVFEVCECL